MKIDSALKKDILSAQKSEITEYHIYQVLTNFIKDGKNKEVLNKIAQEELRHYNFWKERSGQDVKPNKLKVYFYVFLAKIFGLTFGVKLMEKGENFAQRSYIILEKNIEGADAVVADEKRHEQELADLMNEEHLAYTGSVILGLNDALVELTAALAGFTLALQKTKLVGIVGLITGIAAAMSMAASEYLSTKEEATGKNPYKASVYTGVAYILTVIFLIFPYFIFSNLFICLGITISIALLAVFLFTFYTSVAKGLDLKKRFWEMAILSLSIAGINFFIGIIIRKTFGIDLG
ncbi:MAG: VIT1/CCC1 family protein [Candidatus Omnitrophica bacterium]|nr:VIT1/CCC1 family protein [Candidatus Omnitrophota bacterium]MCF7878756.1 VIT1/CCC1 family protein [Candidatus Omnitrophota bacterium]MCF7892869.1 VIT1/CCC1 family protein [Candidatus Omnitrophota bacterium]